MGVTLIIEGIPELKEMLNSKSINTEKFIKTGLSKSGMFMQGEVKESIAGRRNEPTSVDTGRFLNSVDIQVSTDSVVIFSDLEYAKFLEYGTSKLYPRKHFSNSAYRNKNKIGEIIKKEIANI